MGWISNEGKEASFLKKSIQDLELMKGQNLLSDDSYSIKSSELLVDAMEQIMTSPKEVLLVTEGKGVKGVLSKQDMIQPLKNDLHDLRSIRAEKAMSTREVSCFTHETLRDILGLFLSSKAEGIFIKNKSGEKIGFLDSFDILRALYQAPFSFEQTLILRKVMSTTISKIDASMNITELLTYFIEHKTNYALVYRNEELVGIVTIKDLLSSLYKGVSLENTYVQNIMSARVRTLEPWNDLTEAIALVLDKKYNQVPIIEKNNVVGVIGISDLLKGYISFLQSITSGEKEIKEIS